VLVTADDVAATLALVVPGFVALTVFYWLGLRQRRTDWQWLLWSLVVTVPVAWLATLASSALVADSRAPAQVFTACVVDELRAFGQSRPIGAISEAELSEPIVGCSDAAAAAIPEIRFAIALGLGVAAGLAGALAWWVAGRVWPSLHTRAAQTVWERKVHGPAYVRVKTDDATYVGSLRMDAAAADVGDMDDVDILIGNPGILTDEGEVNWLTRVDSMIVRRADIKWLQIMKKPGQPDSGPRAEETKVSEAVTELKDRYRATGARAGVRLSDAEFAEVTAALDASGRSVDTPPDELRYLEGMLGLPLNSIGEFLVIPAAGSEQCACGRMPTALDLVETAIRDKVHDRSLIRETVIGTRNTFEFADGGRLAACHQCGRELRFVAYWKQGYAYG
jgi:Family of unknown function (DUF6338)